MPGEVVVATHQPCDWLPAGGRAEVVLADNRVAPEPTAVVRLLVTAGDAVLTVDRPDGRGTDIPAMRVNDDDVTTALIDLRASVFGDDRAPEANLVGFVRNTVPHPADDYSWPHPLAHFAVWHSATDRSAVRRGTWLDGAAAAGRLEGRHWWPLVEHLDGARR